MGGAVLMGLLDRIINVIKANLNALLEKFEDPEKMVEQALRDLNNLYRESKVAVAQAMAELSKLEKKYAEQVELVNKWQEKAKMALAAGDENLAREALLRKKQHEQTAKMYAQQIEKQKKVVEQLKAKLKELAMKIDELKMKKDTIIARAKTAKAQLQLKEELAKMSDNSILEVIDRMEDKVEHLEAKADAADHMIALESELEGEDLDAKFAQLESISVDDELKALKAEVAGQLPNKKS